MSGARDFWIETKFDWFIVFCWLALAGIVLVMAGTLINQEQISSTLMITGVILIVPFVLHANFLAIWHWKIRYRGSHSKLWGALMLIETTGWLRVIYLVKHVIPDRRNKGRYFRTILPEDLSSVPAQT